MVEKRKVVFIGDSITECFNLKTFFQDDGYINEGVSGYTTLDLLNRLETSLFQYQPDIVFLLIGTNDLELTELTKEEIVHNIKTIVQKINQRLPQATLYLQSIYPVNYEIKPFSVGKRKNEDINWINHHISQIKGAKYLDIHSFLKNKEGKLNSDYTYDGIHINDLGYQVISHQLKEYLK
ncbi:MAG: GDSL-type esterase/lipase family protein [Acholeplasmataceae bacterium]|nr:GDSL-type esterase/lipase family protein [Acholeplasmataceae bacterium]